MTNLHGRMTNALRLRLNLSVFLVLLLCTLVSLTTSRDEQCVSDQQQPTTPPPPAEVVVIKVGGSSITNKAVKESLDEDALDWFAETLSKHIDPRFRAPTEDCRGDAPSTPRSAFVIVHGAGSFGHHTAKEFGLQGHTDPPLTNASVAVSASERRYKMHGAAQTRLSVQTLNRHVVAKLIEFQVSAVGISPCFGIPSFQAHGGEESALQDLVHSTLQAGLTPVLHGDACLYGDSAGILSGDTLMEILGKASWVDRVIFLTDVDGVFTSDPRVDPTAQLVREIAIDEKMRVVDASLDVSGSTHTDVTGGLETKLKSAASIVARGKNVTIARCRSPSAEAVIRKDERIDYATTLYPLQYDE